MVGYLRDVTHSFVAPLFLFMPKLLGTIASRIFRVIPGSPKPDLAIPPCVLPYEVCRFDLLRVARDEHPLGRSMLAARFE